ncbi:hypothetical protein EV426DRAFT_391184 [Tirmania nivea]|nr:hypothetical protein EV426DRAFT_391184 [Tirmania nivea]
MHDKLLLGDMYLEDLIYNFLEGKSKVGDREWWLLESCIVNLDYLSWLDDPTRTKLKSLIPKSPPTPEAISLCEAYLQPFWESANFEDDMPPILARTPWNKPEHYIVYNYYHLLVHYWYNFIPTIGLDPSRGSESWLSARVYNYLFDLFRAPLVSLRLSVQLAVPSHVKRVNINGFVFSGETASLHSPDYRFDGIFCWNNIEFGALEIAPEGTYSSHQAKVDKDCYKLYQVVGKIYNKLNAVANSKVPHPAVGIMCRGIVEASGNLFSHLKLTSFRILLHHYQSFSIEQKSFTNESS